MNKTNPKVDAYLGRAKMWREETEKLRQVILGCDLIEELKWGKPCYAFEGGNVLVIQGFKKYCTLLFFKGVLLKDPRGILQKTGPNARVGRQIRFTSVQEIVQIEPILKSYIRQAVEVERAGLKVDPKENAELVIPEELQNRLSKNRALRTAFYALTPGRQRAYTFYFSAPKQSKTRESRIEKCMHQILIGKGLYDDYASMKKRKN